MAETFKSEGIIFRTLKYSESSTIVDIYTLEKGLRSFLVSGLNSKKNQTKKSLYQHINIVDIVAYDKANGTLGRIKEESLNVHYKQVPYDVVRSSIGLFIIELSRNTIKEEEPNKGLYSYLKSTLLMLDEVDVNLTNFPLTFLIGLSTHIGIQPQNNESEGKPYFDLYAGGYVALPTKYTLSLDESAALQKVLSSETDVKLSKTERGLMLNNLLNYYRLHVEQFKPLKSIEVLRQILK